MKKQITKAKAELHRMWYLYWESHKAVATMKQCAKKCKTNLTTFWRAVVEQEELNNPKL